MPIYRFKYLVVVLILTNLFFSGCGSSRNTSQVLLSENFNSITSLPTIWQDFNGGAVQTDASIYNQALLLNNGSSAIYYGAGCTGWTNYILTFNYSAPNAISAYFRFLPGVQPSRSYYRLDICRDPDTIQLLLDSNDSVSPVIVASINITYIQGSFIPVKVIVNDNNVLVYYNNGVNPVINYTNPSSTDGLMYGTIGFSSGSGLFDDILVKTP